MPEVRAPFLSSTEPLKTSVPITGIIVVLVLLVVTRAVIWIKKLSGREGRDLSFLVSLGVSSPGRSLPASLLESNLHTLVLGKSGAFCLHLFFVRHM